MVYRPPMIQATSTLNNTAVSGSIPTATDSAARDANIRATRAADAAIDAQVGNMQQADAQRAMPRARTDNLNDASGRHLTPIGETIEPPSIFSHRMNRRNANRAIAKFNSAQQRTTSSFIQPTNARQRTIRDSLNRHFESGGSLDDLGTQTKRFVAQLDGAIQKAERENDRMHVVYTSLDVDGTTPREFIEALSRTSGHHQTLLGYTRANHDLNKISGDDSTVYVQIETARGMYVGGNGNSGHLLPRGIELEYVDSSEFDVDDGNGGTTKRTVVQMREVRQNERTTARS